MDNRLSIWTALEPLANACGLPTDPSGYRLCDLKEPEPVEYIGQSGNLKSRLCRHRRNRNAELVFSYAIVDDGDAKHKREQIETDLIGAH